MLAKLATLGKGFLSSQASGYLALAGLAGVLGFGWYVTNLRSNYQELLAQCTHRADSAAEEFAEELKNANREELRKALATLDAADHPCLDWVYDPDSDTRPNPPLP